LEKHFKSPFLQRRGLFYADIDAEKGGGLWDVNV
jgi:hypothetical protein